MITGVGFWRVLTDVDGGNWADHEDEDLGQWHVVQTGVLSELAWPLEDFLKQSEANRHGIISIYLKRFWEATGEPEADLDYLREQVAEFDGHLQALVNGKATKGSKESTSDKWASPGRVVCSWPDLDPTPRLVMFVMAAHARDDGSNIWVSQQKIADYIGMSKRTVQRAMDRLEDAGAIKKTAEARQHKPPTWRLNTGPGVT